VDLQVTIRELKTGYKDFNVGNYKLIRYCGESKILEFSKLITSDDRQDFEGSSIFLDEGETTAFFNVFKKVEDEFNQLVRALPKKPSAGTVSSTQKRRAADVSTSVGHPSPKHICETKVSKLVKRVQDSDVIDLTTIN
jgi:hypothetical protein